MFIQCSLGCCGWLFTCCSGDALWSIQLHLQKCDRKETLLPDYEQYTVVFFGCFVVPTAWTSIYIYPKPLLLHEWCKRIRSRPYSLCYKCCTVLISPRDFLLVSLSSMAKEPENIYRAVLFSFFFVCFGFGCECYAYENCKGHFVAT